MARTGGQILVDCLQAQGVNTAFGVPGESYLAVLDALYDVKDNLRFIGTRHEGGASFMAEAYGKLTGQPGICFVTRGPGATNASIGVHTAMQNSSPMIVFIGQIARDQRDREAFQEVDYRAFFGPIAKWVTEIETTDRIPEIMMRAFSAAMSGRPGPVVIALPEDMLTELSEATAGPKVKLPQNAPDKAQIDEIKAAFSKAKKPVMIIGGGGWTEQGRAALDQFARNVDIPIAAAFRSQDLLDNSLPNYIGDAGVGMSAEMKDILRSADLIFALNIRFGEMVTDAWSLFDLPKMKQTLIHSHASSAELNKIYQADIAVNCTPNALIENLNDAQIRCDVSEWRGECRAKYEALLECPKQPSAVDMGEICTYLRETLDDDAIITNGAGNFAIWPAKFLSYGRDNRMLAPQSGAMGAGIPAAIAAKAVDPKRQVVCFAGDGDFQMTCQELGTAMQENLQPIILLLNNGMYGTIRMHQERSYPRRVSGTEISNPDFVSLARSYGFHAETVNQTSEFEDAFQRASASKTGAVIELMIDQEAIAPRATITGLQK